MDININTIPDSIEQIYLDGGGIYQFQCYDKAYDMDNILAMNFFLETVDIDDEQIIMNDGTVVVFNYKDKQFTISSYGFGDFFSHEFSVVCEERNNNEH